MMKKCSLSQSIVLCLMRTSISKKNDMERVTNVNVTKEKFALVSGRGDDVTPRIFKMADHLSLRKQLLVTVHVPERF